VPVFKKFPARFSPVIAKEARDVGGYVRGRGVTYLHTNPRSKVADLVYCLSCYYTLSEVSKSGYLYPVPESVKTSRWRRAVENRCVFSARLKALSDRSGDRSAGGRRFHVAGPLTAKLR